MRTFRKIRYFYRKFSRKILGKISKFEAFCADIIYDRKSSKCTKIISIPLLILSKIFEQIVRIRCWLYSKQIFLSNPLGCPVIVIGNLTVGGTGKTPVVEKIARELTSRGRKVAILSRGYKSKRESKIKPLIRWITHSNESPPRVVSNGESVLLGSDCAGDEPYMLAKNLPGVVVIVDKDRVKAGQYAIKKYGANVLILDDGFQYLPLCGHMNILLIDQTNPFGNGKLLPRGILREPIDHINRASYVLFTKSDENQDHEIEKKVRQILPNVGIIKCCHNPKYICSIADETDRRDINFLFGKRVCVFSGIAMPDSFENFLCSHGANVAYKKRFIDHHRFTEYELDKLNSTALYHRAEYIVTTEKDAVRIPKSYIFQIPAYFLKIEIEIIDGQELLDEAIMKFISKSDTINRDQ